MCAMGRKSFPGKRLTANEWLSYLYSYGVFAQENIGFFDRYYIDLGLRSDYNTAFGDNVGWQLYPKVGLSYVISEERFMRRLTQGGIVNNLRIMANYGIAGSYPPAFEYQRTVTFTLQRPAGRLFRQVWQPQPSTREETQL